MAYCSTNKTVYSARYLIIWCPKYRRRVRDGRVEVRVKEIIAEAAAEADGEFIEVEVMPDRVHLLVEGHQRFLFRSIGPDGDHIAARSGPDTLTNRDPGPNPPRTPRRADETTRTAPATTDRQSLSGGQSPGSSRPGAGHAGPGCRRHDQLPVPAHAQPSKRVAPAPSGGALRAATTRNDLFTITTGLPGRSRPNLKRSTPTGKQPPPGSPDTDLPPPGATCNLSTPWRMDVELAGRLKLTPSASDEDCHLLGGTSS